MSTVGRESFMDLLRNGGRYLNDPVPESLWVYKTGFHDNLCYKICYSRAAEMSLLNSDAVLSPRMAWSKEGGITDYGRKLL